jgi:hypothetical protein
MAMVQVFDSIIGALAHDPSKTYGPFAIAVLNALAVGLLHKTRTLIRDRETVAAALRGLKMPGSVESGSGFWRSSKIRLSTARVAGYADGRTEPNLVRPQTWGDVLTCRR